MILQRAAVTVTLGPLALWLLYMGGWFVFVPAVAIMLIGCLEFGRMTTALGNRFPTVLVLISVAALHTIASFAPREQVTTWQSATLFLACFAALCHALWHFESGGTQAIFTLFSTFATIIFLGWLGSHLLLLRNISPDAGSVSWEWTAIALVATWSSDVGAYLVGSFLTGKLLGRHALTPRLSPKKTYEGYIGGVIFGFLLASLIGIFWFELPTSQVLILSALLAAVGTLGDLAISMLKRESGIKDSGNIFPGHGGALDRLDSLLWTLPFAYYFLYFASP